MVNYRLFTNKEIKEIVKLYKSGISIQKILRLKHTTYHLVRKILTDQNVELRYFGQHYPLPDKKKFKLDCNRLRIHELAKKYKVTTSRISYWRNRFGWSTGKRELRSVLFQEQSDGCWKCTSHKKGSKGYPRGRAGQLIVKRNWIEKNGVWSSNKIVRHLCAHKWCVNPDHVVPGTQLENLVDAYLDGGMRNKIFFNGMLTKGIQENIIKLDSDGFVIRLVDGKRFAIKGSLNVVVQGTFERLPAKKALRMNARGDTI
jgi:hypothetical protein